MRKIKVIYYRIFRPSIMEKCLQSAHEDIQSLVDNIFTNLAQHGFKVTYGELIYLFERYDWKDIIDAMEEVENTYLSNAQQNLYIDPITIIDDFDPIILRSKWSNSYFFEWLTND